MGISVIRGLSSSEKECLTTTTEITYANINNDVINDLILGCVCVCIVSQGDQSFQNGEGLKDFDKWQIYAVNLVP